MVERLVLRINPRINDLQPRVEREMNFETLTGEIRDDKGNNKM